MADFNLVHLPRNLTDEVGIMLTDTLSTASFGLRRARVGQGMLLPSSAWEPSVCSRSCAQRPWAHRVFSVSTCWPIDVSTRPR